MSNIEDDDEFLYGSESPKPKRQKTTTQDASEDASISEALGLDSTATSGDATKAPPATNEVAATDEGDEEEEEDDEEEDDDSDIEFVIDTKPGQKAEAPSRQVPYSTGKATAANDTAKEAATTGGKEIQRAEKPPGIDINAVAEHNGKPLTEVVIEDLEDKPWRRPGSDITDYFNYGFDEFTWTAYCSKQDTLRANYTPQKVMAMMGMPVFPPEMMTFNQGFPGMPGMGAGGFPPPPAGFMGMNNDDNGAYGGSNIVAGNNNGNNSGHGGHGSGGSGPGYRRK
ncbi:Fip1p [Sugiyamaella lignohabitans]|uniref:Pre-mRNA polyadenylation factor FIP1 n=1 Tax=Sugiyamaella lignohabitans TaxID=796027 RepID=A0A167DLL1_9ASCO|nr:Fip1p [Sugiyamaella lignohabitans]ANB13046.1 Fip1p [Sugiyamaella lignohabitans]